MNHSTIKPLSRVTLLGLLGLLVLAGPTSGAPTDSLFGDGNRAYCAGDYAAAITCYETVARRDGVSPALLHNLARAYQDNGDPGRALLNYERAHWLAPRDAGIRAGLHRLVQDAALFANAGPRWVRPFLGLSLNEWSWLAAAAWAAMGGLILARGLGVKRLPFRPVLAVSAVLLAMSLGGIATRLAQMNRAVVIADHASLRVSPYAAAKQVATISEGKPLTVTGMHGAFCKVRTANGQTGWMAASEVGRITALDAPPPEDATGVVSVDGPGPDATDAGSGG
jgi:hypothetical protein